MSPHDSNDLSAWEMFQEHLRDAFPEALRRLKNAKKRGRPKKRPPSRTWLLRTMSGMFSIVRKRIKGRDYYYLREQGRRAGQLLQRDRFLGRMGFDALPAWLQEIYKGDPAAFEFRADAPDTLGAALEWWGRIQFLADNAKALPQGAGRSRPLAKRDARFLKSARGKVAALKLAHTRQERYGRSRHNSAP